MQIERNQRGIRCCYCRGIETARWIATRKPQSPRKDKKFQE